MRLNGSNKSVVNEPDKPVARKKYKYTVISYIFNNYDQLHEVKCADDDVRYLLITDNKRLKSKTWEIHHYSEYECLQNLPDKWGIMYYIRFHPFEFCDTFVSIYLDASIAIKKSLDKLYMDFMSSNSEYGLSIHPYRNNVYDELNAWNKQRGLPMAEINAQRKLFSKTGFSKLVLFQGGVLLRKKGRISEVIDGLTWHFLRLTGTAFCVARIDQTILSYVIATYMSNSKYFIFSQHLIQSSYLAWMKHGTKEQLVIDSRFQITPSVFGVKINPYRIE